MIPSLDSYHVRLQPGGVLCQQEILSAMKDVFFMQSLWQMTWVCVDVNG